MKKLLLSLVACTLVLGACGTRGAEPDKITTEQKNEAQIKITVPSTYLKEDGLVDEWDSTMYTGVEVKAEETIYYMSKEQQEALISDSRNNLKAMIEQVSKSSKYEAVDEIVESNDFSSIRLYVDSKLYKNSNRDVLFQTIGIPLIHYQLLQGADAESFAIECEVYGIEEEALVELINLPMDLSNGTLE